jgi:diamine N-acetyltransferase
MPGSVFLRGDSIDLRTIERDDLDFIQRSRNDPALRQGMTWNEPENGEQVSEAFEEFISDDNSVSLLIAHDDGPVGMISLFNIDRTAGKSELAYWIAPDAQSSGYATEAAELVVEYVFDERRFHKVVARAFASNQASQRVLEKIGFREEGHLRDAFYKGGQYVDAYRYGLLEGEWNSREG